MIARLTLEVDAVREQQRPRWGWRRLLILIRRDGIAVGEFRFRRVYRSLGLQVRPRKRQPRA